MRSHLRLVLVLAVIAGLVPAAAAGGAPGLPVVTSTTVLADLVQNVGGEPVHVAPLAPAGADPHTFQPTPETMKVLGRARVAFFNGAGLEEWWGKTLKSVGKRDLVVVELAKGLATIKMPGHDRRGDTHAEGLDPHVWLDPILVKTYVERIRDALSKADAANAELYAERARAYSGQLDDLDAWIRSQVETVPKEHRKIVTFHNAFQYFANRYGLAIKGYVVASPGKEPSAKALAELTRRIKRERIPAVFAEADFNPKLLEILARDAGVKVATNLYDGSLSSGPPADTYVNMMRHNVQMIVGALR